MKTQYQEYDRPFNMDVITLERLNDKLNLANLAAIEGDIVRWYRALREVWANSQFKYSNEKDENNQTPSQRIKLKLDKIGEKLQQKPINRQAAGQFMQLQIQTVESELIELERDLCQVLYENNLIFLKSNTQTWQEKIDGDYS